MRRKYFIAMIRALTSADSRLRAISCRIFTLAQPDNPTASLRDYCSGAYTIIRARDALIEDAVGWPEMQGLIDRRDPNAIDLADMPPFPGDEEPAIKGTEPQDEIQQEPALGPVENLPQTGREDQRPVESEPVDSSVRDEPRPGETGGQVREAAMMRPPGEFPELLPPGVKLTLLVIYVILIVAVPVIGFIFMDPVIPIDPN